jgi:YfiH family protein
VTEAPAMALRDSVEEFAAIGVVAFTTTRAAGDYGLGDGDPPAEALARWQALQISLTPAAIGLASARQVHGTRVMTYDPPIEGWHRAEGADGHSSFAARLACAVTIADCVPVFLAHPTTGAAAIPHAGWRGTAARIVQKSIQQLRERGHASEELRMHLGPAICGRCYMVSPDVFEQLTGWTTARQRNVDLRALLAEQAKELGVTDISVSPYCTKCDNDRFFSHRAGDRERQISVIVTPGERAAARSRA